MLDLKFIRENPHLVREAIRKKKEKDRLDEILKLDADRRELLQKSEAIKSERNKIADDVAKLKRQGQDVSELIAAGKSKGDALKNLEDSLKKVEEKLNELVLYVPNVPHSSVPDGNNSDDNVEVRKWGEVRTQKDLDFKLTDHLTLGEKLGVLDFGRGSKITGAGFPVYVGKGAALERALINFMLDLHVSKHGYTEIFPPFLVNQASMRGTGQLPKMAEDMYHCEVDDLYLIPTAEVPVTNLRRDEILPVEQLPTKYAAYSACFRREAGSWGKESRGFLRVHQFNKVELVKFSKPEESYDELEKLVADVEEVLQLLNIPYRVMLLCAGDLSFSAAKCYDIEVFAPATEARNGWLEASSCSNFESFQARRANIRFKRDPKSKPEFVHTLNGSGLATSRLMVALLENYQTPEGKVIVPKALHKYTGFTIIG
ncbi:MAG: serine--tRNA ligase [Bacteroidetes bacterium]|nr:serine--tRNA ligase [Bacteroidota bacterium]MCL5738629.1 serine--tRNA ligase [Bacteroidota bacterium]